MYFFTLQVFLWNESRENKKQEFLDLLVFTSFEEEWEGGWGIKHFLSELRDCELLAAFTSTFQCLFLLWTFTSSSLQHSTTFNLCVRLFKTFVRKTFIPKTDNSQNITFWCAIIVSCESEKILGLVWARRSERGSDSEFRTDRYLRRSSVYSSLQLYQLISCQAMIEISFSRLLIGQLGWYFALIG